VPEPYRPVVLNTNLVILPHLSGSPCAALTQAVQIPGVKVQALNHWTKAQDP